MSGHPIAALTTFERHWPHARLVAEETAGVAKNHLYVIGRFAVEEPAWSARAELVDAGISTVLDRLESTGVLTSDLCRSDVHVRAYFTLPPGAETIRADTIERLSAVNATLWIDA